MNLRLFPWNKKISEVMAELTALLSEIDVLSPGSHIHIVTDQHNLESYFPPEFQIQTPNTFYKITYRTFFGKQKLNYLPTILPQKIRSCAIIRMLVLLVLSPQLKSSEQIPSTELEKLSHAVNSARNLVEVPTKKSEYGQNFEAATHLRGEFTMFWLTGWVPTTGQHFPSEIFFTKKISGIESQKICTMLFVIKIQNQNSEIIFICAHCSIDPYPKLITVGYISNRVVPSIAWKPSSVTSIGTHTGLLTLINMVAPVETVILKISQQHFNFILTGCDHGPEPQIGDLASTGFFCGLNLTIHQMSFFKWKFLNPPIIYYEGYTREG